MDDHERLQKEPTCDPGPGANDGDCSVEDFWRHQLNRIKDDVEKKEARENV
jgi:hypothetical protein